MYESGCTNDALLRAGNVSGHTGSVSKVISIFPTFLVCVLRFEFSWKFNLLGESQICSRVLLVCLHVGHEARFGTTPEVFAAKFGAKGKSLKHFLPEVIA